MSDILKGPWGFRRASSNLRERRRPGCACYFWVDTTDIAVLRYLGYRSLRAILNSRFYCVDFHEQVASCTTLITTRYEFAVNRTSLGACSETIITFLPPRDESTQSFRSPFAQSFHPVLLRFRSLLHENGPNVTCPLAADKGSPKHQSAERERRGERDRKRKTERERQRRERRKRERETERRSSLYAGIPVIMMPFSRFSPRTLAHQSYYHQLYPLETGGPAL